MLGNAAGWVVDREGQNPVQFGKESGRMFSWEGWLGPAIAVTFSYSGGGHFGLSLIDIHSQKDLASGAFYGVNYEIGKDYVAIDGDSETKIPLAVVLGKNLPVLNDTSGMDNRPFGNIRLFPLNTPNDPNERVSVCFEQWLPGSNRMLVNLNRYYSYEKVSSALYWWDVDQNKSSKAAENALGGKISPDGKTLAYVTMQPNLTADALTFPFPQQEGTIYSYLYLQDVTTKQVFLGGIPIKASEYMDDACGTYYVWNPTPQIAFSPGGRYLAIQTGQKLILNGNGTLAINQDGEKGDYLYLLDLRNKQVVWSASGAELPPWSPDGKDFLVQGADKNWTLINVETLHEMPVTRVPMDAKISWSFDGSYFLMNPYNAFQDDQWIAIIKTP
jgi:hypothetical protein